MTQYFYTLLFVLSLSLSTTAQVRYTPATSVHKNATVTNNKTDGEVDIFIYYHNTSDSSQEVFWKFVEDTVPNNWGIGLCDNNACFYNDDDALYVQRKSSPILAGDSMFLKVVLNPNCVSGPAMVKVYVHIKGDFAPADTLTYTATVDASNCVMLGVSELAAANNIITFPNPATDLVYIKGLPANSNYKLELLDIQGRVIRNNISSFGKEILPFTCKDLQQGMYFIRIVDAENNFMKVTSFFK